MVGELNVNVADQLIKVQFRGAEVVLRAGLRSAKRIAHQQFSGLEVLGRILAFADIRLSASLGLGLTIELFPNPNAVSRWLFPNIRVLNESQARN